MTEADWKILRTVKEAALGRLCARILDECQLVTQGSGTAHERYLRLYEVVHEGDEKIARAFNGLSGSTADLRLASMAGLGLVTDEEMGRFSQETRERTMVLMGINR